MVHGEYQKTEVHNLGRFISVMKFRPLVWRSTHPYLLGDRMEDVTDPEVLRTQPKADRTVALYGYLRGTNMKSNQGLHLAGVGDFSIQSITFLPDPCPLPEGIMKRTLVEKDKTIYAPMSGVGGIVYDKDAVYIDLGGSHAHKKADTEDDLVQNMINTESTLNDKLEQSELRLFSGSKPISSAEHKEGEGRERRKAVFEDGKDDVGIDNDEGDDDSDMEDEEEGEDDEMEEEESDEEVDDTNPKKRKVEDVVAPSPLKKKKEDNVIKSRNKQLLMEMGEDVGESDEDSDDENFPATEESSNIENSTKDVPDTFRHRLATKKDESVHSKVTEALSNIKEKEPEESGEDESEDEDSQEEDEDEEDEEDEEESMEEDGDDDVEASESLHWKADLAMKARDSFYARQSGTASLRRLVYGVSGQEEEDKMGQEEDTVGGLFTVVKAKGGVAKQEMDSLDCTVWRVEHSQDWDREEIKDRIKDCFVTGQWAKGQDAEELIKLDDEDEVYGDFEDLETGQVVSGEKEEEDEEEELPRMVDLKGDRDAEMAKRKES